jgi:3-oxoacyl-[acyl-carrier-protein] synthase II
MDEVVRAEGADLLSPLTSPYFSINLLVGRLSTEFEARGGATTFTTPTTAGLDALAACARSRRRPGLALVGAVEVPPPGGEPGSGPHESPETGAVLLALTPGGPGPRLTARGASWAPGTVDADLRHLIGSVAPDGPRPPVTLLLSDEAKQHVSGALLGDLAGDLADVLLDGAGPGSFRPMAALAEAVREDHPRILVVAGPDGRLAAARIDRSPAAEELA